MIKQNLRENFVFEKILSVDNDKKLIYILGRLKQDDVVTGNKGILKIEKEAFDQEMISKFNSEQPLVEEDMYFQNDAFHKLFVQMTKPYNRVQVDFIYPSTQSLIDKYSK